MYHFIRDKKYRNDKEYQLKARKLIVSASEFSVNLNKIIMCGKSKFPIEFYDIDMRRQEALYAERFLTRLS